jgi:hypothetical protein
MFIGNPNTTNAASYNASTGAYFYNGSETTDHAVTLVGWNDNFPRTDFNASRRPSANGAWLVKNSWGTNWGIQPPGLSERGYFWISYEDTRSPLFCYVIDGVAPYDPNTKVYEYDPHGFSGRWGWEGVSVTYGANVFTVEGSVQNLEQVKFFLPDANTTTSIYIVPNYTDIASLNLTTSQRVMNSNVFMYPGWYTFDLPSPIPLTAARFAVIVEYRVPQGNTAWAPSARTVPGDLGNTAPITLNVSYRATNGTPQWFANTETQGNLNIKAVTKPASVTVVPSGSGRYKPGDTFQAALNLSGNPGFAGMSVKVEIPQGLTLTRYDIGTAFNTNFYPPDGVDPGEPINITGRFYLLWVNTANYTQNGTLATLTFTVASDAALGEYPLNISFETAQGPRAPVNLNGSPLSFSITNAAVIIEKDAEITVVPAGTGVYKPGETFQAAINLDGNPGFAGMAIRAAIPQGLILTRYDIGTAFSQNFYPPDGANPGSRINITGQFYLLWVNTANYTQNGTLATLHFTVAASAEAGEYPLNISFETAQGPRTPVDLNGSPLSINIKNAAITIERIIIPGDIDGDGRVSSNDVTLLRRYIDAVKNGKKAEFLDENKFFREDNAAPLAPLVNGEIDDKAVEELRKIIAEGGP